MHRQHTHTDERSNDERHWPAYFPYSADLPCMASSITSQPSWEHSSLAQSSPYQAFPSVERAPYHSAQLWTQGSRILVPSGRFHWPERDVSSDTSNMTPVSGQSSPLRAIQPCPYGTDTDVPCEPEMTQQLASNTALPLPSPTHMLYSLNDMHGVLPSFLAQQDFINSPTVDMSLYDGNHYDMPQAVPGIHSTHNLSDPMEMTFPKGRSVSSESHPRPNSPYQALHAFSPNIGPDITTEMALGTKDTSLDNTKSFHSDAAFSYVQREPTSLHAQSVTITYPLYCWVFACLYPKKRPDKNTPAPSGTCLLCSSVCRRPGVLQQHVNNLHRQRLARRVYAGRPYNLELGLLFVVAFLQAKKRPSDPRDLELECIGFIDLMKTNPDGVVSISQRDFPLLSRKLEEQSKDEDWVGVQCPRCGTWMTRAPALREHDQVCRRVKRLWLSSDGVDGPPQLSTSGLAARPPRDGLL